MPPVPYDACDQRSTRVTSLSLVRDRRNDYSVPTAYGHRAVVVKGYVDEVVIVCGSEEIARHRRSDDRDVLIFDPRHYLALWERKTGALDQAAPRVGWALPEEFLRLRRLLEARLGKPGTREYVQVLRRLEDFRLAHVRGAVRDALTLGVIGFDAVKHLTLCRIEHRPPQLDLAQYPHLPAARVATTAAADYLALLVGAAGCWRAFLLCSRRRCGGAVESYAQRSKRSTAESFRTSRPSAPPWPTRRHSTNVCPGNRVRYIRAQGPSRGNSSRLAVAQ